MRLFVAAFLPETLQRQLLEALSPCRSWPGVRWTAPDALHLTLKFLGETPDNRRGAVSSAVAQAASGGRLRLSIASGGGFPNLKRPRILWAGVSGETDRLIQLAGRIEEAVAPLGYRPEGHPFHPHLTLGRPGPAFGRGLGERFGTLLRAFSTPSFEVADIHLVQSHLGSQGSRYETLESYSLLK